MLLGTATTAAGSGGSACARVAALVTTSSAVGISPIRSVTSPSRNAEPSPASVRFQKVTASRTSKMRASPAAPITVSVGLSIHPVVAPAAPVARCIVAAAATARIAWRRFMAPVALR
jgi:hypothetical protein